MPIQDLIDEGAIPFVIRLQDAGETYQQVILRLAQRYPDESPNTLNAAIGAAVQARQAASIADTTILEGKVTAGDVRPPAPGCLAWRYTLTATATDSETGNSNMLTYIVDSPYSLTIKAIGNDVRKQAEDNLRSSEPGCKKFVVKGDITVTIDAFQAIERVCP